MRFCAILSKMTTFDHIAEQLRQRRRELNISQQELAAITGIGIATLNRIESGKHIPGLRTLMPLADALGLMLALQPKPQTYYYPPTDHR